MSCLGNLIWFLFGGLWLGLGWVLAGLLWCVTIIGIPIGMQCFKLAGLAFFPFGKEVVYGGGLGSFFLNLLWLAVSGRTEAIQAAATGCVFCVTIIGIPFGMQCFKLAKLSLMPFSTGVVSGRW